MVNALIFAGGIGTRMNSKDNIPKQFLRVDGVPIIIRTLMHFEKHDDVKKILVVCVEDWIEELQRLLVVYRIKKVINVIPGGETGFQSIHNGVEYLDNEMEREDIILICDGVRPCLSEELISDCIKTAEKYGTAVPVTPSIDSVLYSEEGKKSAKNLSRKNIFITQAPQGYKMKKIVKAHNEAIQKGIESVSSADLLIELGYEVKIFKGIRENIKVTTIEDLNSLRATQYYEHFREFAEEELNIIKGEK